MSKINWILEKRKVKDLIPHLKNPRLFTKKGMKDLEKSIKNIGMAQPVNITKDGVILSGHARIMKLKEMGAEEVDVYVPNVDLTEKQQEEIIVRMNANTAGEWDFEKLANEFELPELTEWGLEIPQIENFEPEETVDDDEVPDQPVKAITIKGDLYELGKHRLLCGDSTMIDDVEKLRGGAMIDLTWTDPPYNIDYEGSDGQKIQNDNMTDSKFKEFLVAIFTNCFLSSKDGAPIYVAHADSEGVNFRTALIEGGFALKSCLIWVKNAFTFGRADYKWQHEPILYGWKEGSAHKWYGGFDKSTVIDDDIDLKKLDKRGLIDIINNLKNDFNGTVLRQAKPLKNDLHPTMKPVALVQRMISNSSKVGDAVLDLFGGSGSTLIACEKMNRNGYLMEMDEKYCDVIVKRYIQFCEANSLEPSVKRNGEDCLNEFKA